MRQKKDHEDHLKTVNHHFVAAYISLGSPIVKEKMGLFHYVPLHSSPAGIKYARVSGKMVVTDDISERILRLPMYYEMRDEEIERVVEAVEEFYRNS